jgi:hypothetical protein
MTETAANVLVGVNGAVYRAALGSTLPTDPSTSLNAAFKHVGYVGDEGVIESTATEVSEVKAWGGDVVRKIQTKHDVTYAFTMLETNDETMGVYYGTGNFATETSITGDELDHNCWVIEVLDGDDTLRVVIPDGQITERGDVGYVGEDAAKYPVTVTCYPDNTGVKAYKYKTA